MAATPSLLYRGTLTTSSATLKTTDTIATTIVTSIVATNKTSSASWFTVTINGFYVAYQMPIAAYQTITIDVKQVTGVNVIIAGLAGASSTIDLSISGVVSTGPTDQAWVAYTPTLRDNAGTALSNWTCTGYYTQIGKTVHCKWAVIGVSTPGLGTGGTLRIDLPPVTPKSNIALGPSMAYCFDQSATNIIHPRIAFTTTYITMWYPNTWPSGTNSSVTTTTFSWAVNDEIGGALTYEAA